MHLSFNDVRYSFPPAQSLAQCHYLTAAADNQRRTLHLLPRYCRHSGVKLPLRCRRRRHTQQSSSRSAAVLSHCPGVNFLPPSPHPTLPVDGRPLFSQRADCNQTLPPPLDGRLSSSQRIDRDLLPLQGSYQPSQETSRGHLSLATVNIMLHPTIHIMS